MHYENCTNIWFLKLWKQYLFLLKTSRFQIKTRFFFIYLIPAPGSLIITRKYSRIFKFSLLFSYKLSICFYRTYGLIFRLFGGIQWLKIKDSFVLLTYKETQCGYDILIKTPIFLDVRKHFRNFYVYQSQRYFWSLIRASW